MFNVQFMLDILLLYICRCIPHICLSNKKSPCTEPLMNNLVEFYFVVFFKVEISIHVINTSVLTSRNKLCVEITEMSLKKNFKNRLGCCQNVEKTMFLLAPPTIYIHMLKHFYSGSFKHLPFSNLLFMPKKFQESEKPEQI